MYPTIPFHVIKAQGKKEHLLTAEHNVVPAIA